MNGYVLITKLCNMNCEYCYYNIGMIKKDNSVITDETLYNAIRYLKSMGADSIQFTGGECFTAIDQLKKGVIYAKEHGLKVVVATNLKVLQERSELLDEDWTKNIDGFVASIHIDNHTEEYYYNKLVGCVKRVMLKGKKIRLIFTISAVNYTHTSKIVSDCDNLGIELMLQLVSTKGAEDDINYLYSLKQLDEDAIDCVIADLRRWAKDDKNGVTYINQLIRYLKNQEMQLDNCSAGEDFLVVSPKGDIYPCFTLEEPCFGNVNRKVDVSKIKDFCKKEKSCTDLFCVCKSIKY